jgi:hypothetical protein
MKSSIKTTTQLKIIQLFITSCYALFSCYQTISNNNNNSSNENNELEHVLMSIALLMIHVNWLIRGLNANSLQFIWSATIISLLIEGTVAMKLFVDSPNTCISIKKNSNILPQLPPYFSEYFILGQWLCNLFILTTLIIGGEQQEEEEEEILNQQHHENIVVQRRAINRIIFGIYLIILACALLVKQQDVLNWLGLNPSKQSFCAEFQQGRNKWADPYSILVESNQIAIGISPIAITIIFTIELGLLNIIAGWYKIEALFKAGEIGGLVFGIFCCLLYLIGFIPIRVLAIPSMDFISILTMRMWIK